MNEYDFAEQALQLKRNIYGTGKQLQLLRDALEKLIKKMENKTDDEAYRVYLRYWHRYSSQCEILKNLSQNEINQVFRQRKTLRNFCLQLLRGGRNLTAALSKIRSWKHSIELAAKAYESFKIGAGQQRREEYQNAISQINDMQEAKANMQKMMNLMNTAIQRFKLPFVTQIVSMYTSIFNELCKFCDKVADYAKKLEREAEKALGTKSGWDQVLNNDNSLWNKRNQILLGRPEK